MKRTGNINRPGKRGILLHNFSGVLPSAALQLRLKLLDPRVVDEPRRRETVAIYSVNRVVMSGE